MNKIEISDWLKKLQDTICNDLEIADDGSKFEEEIWERKEGGGGRSRIFKDGKYIEKGGVLFSAVDGLAPEFLDIVFSVHIAYRALYLYTVHSFNI